MLYSGGRSSTATIVAEALAEPYVFVNGSQRGLQARFNPHEAAKLFDAVVAQLTSWGGAPAVPTTWPLRRAARRRLGA